MRMPTYRQQAKYGPRRFAATEARSYNVIKIRSSHASKLSGSVQRHIVIAALLLASSSVLLLSGCSSALNLGQGDTGAPTDAVTIKGKVQGGQFPVVNSTVYVYEIGATAMTAGGYSGATTAPSVVGTSGLTTANGGWQVTVTCNNSSDYLVFASVGGEGGVSAQNATNNTALVLTSVAPQPCGTFVANPGFIWIDEVTTVVTEYALSGFSSNYNHVGTSGTNTLGLINAFNTISNLVNLSTGNAYTVTPAYATAPAHTTPDVFGSIVPQDLIYTLANILSSCVNATGGAGSTACDDLLGDAGGVGTTADAALYIAHHPANNVALIYALRPASGAPYGPALTSAPADFTMTVNYVGGGLGGVTSATLSGAINLAIDLDGNIWVPNAGTTTVTKLNNLGAPLSSNSTDSGTIAAGGYTSSGFSSGGEGSITTDQTGQVFVADYVNCVVGFTNAGTPLSPTSYSEPCDGHTEAEGVAIDKSNDIWVNAATWIGESNNLGNSRAFTPVTSGFDTLTSALAPDPAGDMWVVDEGNSSSGYISSTGIYTKQYPNDSPEPGSYIAFGQTTGGADGCQGGLELWVPLSGLNAIQLFGGVSPYTEGSELTPSSASGVAGIQADGNSNFFYANQAGSISGTPYPDNITEYTCGGTQVSPESGGYVGGTALSRLGTPAGLAVDQSGNVWVLNENNYDAEYDVGPYGADYIGGGTDAANVTEFIGLGAPANPVAALNAASSTFGIKP